MPAVQLVVTGFSKFFGVEDNPTEDLVKWLAGLPDSQFHAGTGRCICFDTLKVSMKGVDAQMGQLRELANARSSPGDVVLWVHFGVASGAQEFSLEAVGYNEANFRCPDEDGQQPRHQAIDASQPLGAELYTQLPLNALQERLVQKGHPVAVSIDPGRFVCNYIYYRSLQQHQQQPTHPEPAAANQLLGQQNGDGTQQRSEAGSSLASNGNSNGHQRQVQGNWGADSVGAAHRSLPPGTSVFVHVPEFSDICREDQRRFVLDLLHEVSIVASELTLAAAASQELEGKASPHTGVKLTVYH